jgi:hypothetical protein
MESDAHDDDAVLVDSPMLEINWLESCVVSASFRGTSADGSDNNTFILDSSLCSGGGGADDDFKE